MRSLTASDIIESQIFPNSKKFAPTIFVPGAKPVKWAFTAYDETHFLYRQQSLHGPEWGIWPWSRQKYYQPKALSKNAEITDDEKAWIINIACQKPVDLGYSAEVWTRALLAKHINKYRFEFVFTPKHGSWLNLIEGFFSKLTRQSLKGIRVKTKGELVERIYKYFDEVNADPVVYHWKYKLEEIDSSEEVEVDTLPIKKSS